LDIRAPQVTALTDAVRALLRFEHPADSVMRAWFREHPDLGARDRALVADTAFGILRHLRRLQHLAPDQAPRKLVLAWMVLQQGRAVRSIESMLSKEETSWLEQMKGHKEALPPAIELSLPDWLFELMAQEFAPDDLTALGRALLEPAPLDLRVNTLRTRREDVLASLAASGVEATPCALSPMGVRLREKPALERHDLFTSGQVEVQDEGSQLVSILTDVRRGQMVVDFCAGAGGKTLALGALMRSEGRLYAFDTNDRRLTQFKPRLKRSGLSNVHPQLIDTESDVRVKRLAGKIDRVLVDAPCSGTGTLRRNPDIKWRMRPGALDELRAKQASILHAAARLPKVGGRLVYATCSLLRTENEGAIEDFLTLHPGWEIVDAPAILRKAGIAFEAPGPHLRLYPHIHGTDGFFAAVLERKA
jgi:16S rRNA (cytosine967-C5)-methyltransferase